MANLQQKLPGVRKLQNVSVLWAVAANPYVVFVVHEHAVFVVRPFIFGRRAAPGLHQIPSHVEFQNRRRRNTAIGLRRIERRVLVVVIQRSRPAGHPDVIVRIDKDAAHLPSIQLCGNCFGQYGSGSKCGTPCDQALTVSRERIRSRAENPSVSVRHVRLPAAGKRSVQREIPDPRSPPHILLAVQHVRHRVPVCPAGIATAPTSLPVALSYARSITSDSRAALPAYHQGLRHQHRRKLQAARCAEYSGP